MLNIRKSMILVALLVLCVGAAAAQTSFTTSPLTPGNFVVRDIIHPLAPQQLTQNSDPNTLVSGTSVACSGGGITTDNHWWRLFDLDDDHLLTDTLTIASVDYGIETSVGPQSMTATTHCLDEGLPFLLSFLTLADSNTVNQPEAELEFFNIAVGGSCDTATQDLALDMSTDDCLESGTCLSLFIGCNDLGQSAPFYVHADDCGIFDPVDLAGLGFPNAHGVYVVNGDAGGGTGDGGSGDGAGDGAGDGGGDGGGVPASTGIGMLLMVLVLLGSSAYFLRRRAEN
jgi:hypothetical protein